MRLISQSELLRALWSAALLRPRRFNSRSNLSAVLWRERATLKVRTISRVRVLSVVFCVCFCVVFFAIGRSPNRHATFFAAILILANSANPLFRLSVLAVGAFWILARHHNGRRLFLLLRVIVAMINFQFFRMVNAIILLVELFPLVSMIWAERGALLAIEHHCAAWKIAWHHIWRPGPFLANYGTERQYSDDWSMALTR
jgi:hypothetical protein